MLQKVDLDIGLSNEEERASVGAMAASAGKLAAVLHRRTRKVTSALAYAARPLRHAASTAPAAEVLE